MTEWLTEPDFDSFVAYDFETTGLSPTGDAIIEIGAFRVVNGEVVESREMARQEFVRPCRSYVSPGITALTGIRPEQVAEARTIDIIVPAFLKWVGSDVLIGYNNAGFDHLFLEDACRLIRHEPQLREFDVLKYARPFKSQLGLERMNLGSVSAKLEIVNPRAHRALADALTTARVYLKLREMEARGELIRPARTTKQERSAHA